MSLTKLTADLDNIQALSNKPNEVEGLTADQLKEKFDDAGNEIKTYVNDTLTAEQDTINADVESRLSTAEGEIDTAETNIINLKTGWNAISATLTYSSADDPTYVVGTSVDLTGILSVGMKIKLTQTTAKYFFVTAIDSTTITLYGGTDYTLANAAISNVYYSTEKAPFGFPLDIDKWSVVTISNAYAVQNTPTQNVYYNPSSLNLVVPIGKWNLGWCANAYPQRASAAICEQQCGLSTSTSSFTDPKLNGSVYGESNTKFLLTICRENTVTLTSKTTYYLLARTTQTNMSSIAYLGSDTYGNTIIKATIAYL